MATSVRSAVLAPSCGTVHCEESIVGFCGGFVEASGLGYVVWRREEFIPWGGENDNPVGALRGAHLWSATKQVASLPEARDGHGEDAAQDLELNEAGSVLARGPRRAWGGLV